MENFARQTEWVDKISKDTLSSVCSNNSWILSNVIPQLLCNFAQIWPSVCALEEMCFWHTSFGNQFLSCQNEGGTPVLISNLFALHIISWHWQSEKNKTNFHPTYMIMARVTIYAHLGQKNLHSIPFLYVSRNKRWKMSTAITVTVFIRLFRPISINNILLIIRLVTVGWQLNTFQVSSRNGNEKLSNVDYSFVVWKADFNLNFTAKNVVCEQQQSLMPIKVCFWLNNLLFTTNQIFHGHPAANVRRVLSSSRLRYFLWTMKKSAHMQLRFS